MAGESDFCLWQCGFRLAPCPLLILISHCAFYLSHHTLPILVGSFLPLHISFLFFWPSACAMLHALAFLLFHTNTFNTHHSTNHANRSNSKTLSLSSIVHCTGHGMGDDHESRGAAERERAGARHACAAAGDRTRSAGQSRPRKVTKYVDDASRSWSDQVTTTSGRQWKQAGEARRVKQGNQKVN